MISVQRYDHKERVSYRGTPREKTIPAFYECYYYHGGKEIASYDSRFDTLYLKTKLISKDRSMNYYNRALAGEHKEAYAYLFNMLGVDETSTMSEYMNM